MPYERRGILLGRKFNYSDLEKALTEAAKDFDWRVDVSSDRRKYYDLSNVLDPVDKETKILQISSVEKANLPYWLNSPFPLMRIFVYEPKEPTRFYLDTGSGGVGYASETNLNNYLMAVSNKLNNNLAK
ncbi:MAG: hypothetical protein AABW41_05600 [Nanoarchaeota archaeon]